MKTISAVTNDGDMEAIKAAGYDTAEIIAIARAAHRLMIADGWTWDAALEGFTKAAYPGLVMAPRLVDRSTEQ